MQKATAVPPCDDTISSSAENASFSEENPSPYAGSSSPGNNPLCPVAGDTDQQTHPSPLPIETGLVTVSTDTPVIPLNAKTLVIRFHYTGTQGEVYYGMEPAVLQRKTEAGWLTVPQKEGIAWIALAAVLSPQSPDNLFTVEFSRYQEDLQTGVYRSGKKLSNQNEELLFVEFEVKN